MAGLDSAVDIFILVAYFVLVIVVGVLSTWKKERNTIKGYFLAGSSMTWLPIGASLFSSNIGSEHFIGLAGSGAASGIGVVAFEWGAAVCLILLGWVFIPVYRTSGLFTVPEYLYKRFGGSRLRLYMSVLATILNIVSKISVDVYAGALFVRLALGWNTYLSIIFLLGITAVYTIAGGLAAVMFTDTLQTFIMLIGSLALSIMAFVKVGGLGELMYKYFEAIPDSYRSLNGTGSIVFGNNSYSRCGLPRADAFHLIRDPVTSDLPWPGVLLRSTLISIMYWCGDQIIVQRVLAAKSIAHARGGTIFAGLLKFLPLFLIIMPGMISRVLYPESLVCQNAEMCMKACGNTAGCSNLAYPKLILNLAPVGMRGVMMAVMIAALMSSLTSVFNSSAIIFTLDIWKKFRPSASERELLIIGKVFVVILVAISIAWIPFMETSQQGQLFMYIQAINGYLVPPFCAVLLLAVFVPRVNEQGAFWGLMIGLASGLVRMILDFVYTSPRCGEVDTRPNIIANVHHTYFAAILFVETVIVTTTVSLCTKRAPPEQIKGLTFWTTELLYTKEEKTQSTKAMLSNDIELPNDLADSPSAPCNAEVKDKTDINGSSLVDPASVVSSRLTRQPLHINRRTSLFLNLCAVTLVVIYITLYIIFN